jgi:cytoskeletal protein RodZ
MKRIAVVVMLAAGAVLASCGGSSPPATTTTTTTTTTTPSGASGVQDLTVTTAIKSALLAAGAASHQLPVTDYTGLTKGLTYYAYDPGDALYWAGAQLVPSSSSEPAQVGAQDDGSYDLFTMTSGGTWTAYNDGLGTLAGSSCSIVVPAAVRTVWGWSLTTPCGGPTGS